MILGPIKKSKKIFLLIFMFLYFALQMLKKLNENAEH